MGSSLLDQPREFIWALKASVAMTTLCVGCVPNGRSRSAGGGGEVLGVVDDFRYPLSKCSGARMALHAVHSRYGMDGIPSVSDTIFLGGELSMMVVKSYKVSCLGKQGAEGRLIRSAHLAPELGG
jgi:hypothetical protein